ncbi:SAM-dependent DNA methyltransferase [aff. Roholtiella sp. LEGE 12411]|uniref:SAM-dependent DNA methyltransferase n=1 Tax=aff. Roholtiella sp. LEGE 12411 TaxID=1828822 RepID=UPI00187EFF5F|nr:SAM-dependent DNA methyltransferase [aff. Roholtiella sp. LEGE 12411]MBE9038176.1 SAM-dependent DNA methyltransferase [aff. Roholtiella sp. LEGE 12411]
MSVANLPATTDWTNDDWETPDNIALFMSQLVCKSDRRILEPCSGSGQIIKFLPKHIDLWAIEINYARVWEQIKVGGLMHQLDRTWDIQHYDFLGKACEPDFLKEYKEWVGFDLVITNPPFSKCMEFIGRSLQMLNFTNPDARLLFLMPSDIFQAKSRSRAFSKLNAHIHHIYPIVGRVDYLINGVPASQTYVEKNGKLVRRSGRQTCDAIWDIRPGKQGSCTTFIN